LQAVTSVFPAGSWRDFDFPEHSLVNIDSYADYSGQELYTDKKPAQLFDITDVTRLKPADGSHSPERDYFRLSLSILQPFPAVALAGRWYAFDRDHKLVHSEDLAPYAVSNRKDTESGSQDTLQLPGAAWWDKPEVDSIVFVFGTETKKVARFFSKSGASFLSLPIPEVEALGGAALSAEKDIPVRTY